VGPQQQKICPLSSHTSSATFMMYQDKQHSDTPDLIPSMADIHRIIYPAAPHYYCLPWQALPQPDRSIGQPRSHVSLNLGYSISSSLKKPLTTLLEDNVNTRKGSEAFSTNTATTTMSDGDRDDMETSMHWKSVPPEAACVSCKARKLRCDKNKPSCSRCYSRGSPCKYFRARNRR
jgi:hypothetical protein